MHEQNDIPFTVPLVDIAQALALSRYPGDHRDRLS